MAKPKGRLEDIDAHLKRAFSQIENEALPDKLTDLLEKLRQQDKQGGAAGADSGGPEAQLQEAGIGGARSE
ncbi:two-component response regulator [Oceanicola granulosus HTCC2516]|uniref:Two-component response regulator n=1 Tax=Oceanicola granulosus (strain ATCC BAA-861 / DSM 15982 / KCTC 12143 / HTCC2516) TaxID=314256 RepID=Q2CIU2_OCEGH|nr:NepR family anti-sigma factor [Oceanicola granulosus]EAR52497.1 two-component response regulator [Oceanicola granulosus HTCC2516]